MMTPLKTFKNSIKSSLKVQTTGLLSNINKNHLDNQTFIIKKPIINKNKIDPINNLLKTDSKKTISDETILITDETQLTSTSTNKTGTIVEEEVEEIIQDEHTNLIVQIQKYSASLKKEDK